MPRGVRDTARTMLSRGADLGECHPGKKGEMTVSLDEQEDIRRMDRDGVPRSRIARELGVSRNTVAKYANMEDMSPEAPLARRRARPATDGLSAWIDSVPEADLGAPRKRRHTAKRVYDRAMAEMGYEGSCSSIRRYVGPGGRGTSRHRGRATSGSSGGRGRPRSTSGTSGRGSRASRAPSSSSS